MSSNIGGYFNYQIYSTPQALSKLIRSGTSQADILEGISRADRVTDENLCDALDREVALPIFQALIAKVERIGESVLTCAIYQSRSEEIMAMLHSGKTSVTPEWVLEKAKSKKLVEAIRAQFPMAPYSPPESRELERWKNEIPEEAPTKSEEIAICEGLKKGATQAANEGNLTGALRLAMNITFLKMRDEALDEISRCCFEVGDREAVALAFKISLAYKYKDSTCDFIEGCKQLKDRALAKEMSLRAINCLQGDLRWIKLEEMKQYYR